MQKTNALFVLFFLVSSFSFAESSSTQSAQNVMSQKNEKSFIEQLDPYSATYSTVWKKGISFKIKGTQTFTKKSDNRWQLSFKAKTFFASLKESTLFSIVNNHIQPIRYEYHTSAFGKKRDAILTFDWEKKRVTNDVKNKPWKMAVELGTLDKLSVQLQIRQDIKNQKEELSYQVADGGYSKQWKFKKVATETIKTKLGTMKATKVMRVDDQGKKKKTIFWFAEKYDYLLVKLEHKDGKESYLLELESISSK